MPVSMIGTGTVTVPLTVSVTVSVTVLVQNEDVVIKVADEGGGIRRSYMSRIWSYLFTTADPAVQKGFVELGEVRAERHTLLPFPAAYIQ